MESNEVYACSGPSDEESSNALQMLADAVSWVSPAEIFSPKDSPAVVEAAEAILAEEAATRTDPVEETEDSAMLVLTKAVHAKAYPAKAVPAKAVPAKAFPAKAVPAKAVPAKAVPAKAVPAKAVPAKAAPAKAVPAKAVPAKVVPAKAVPTKGEPATVVSVKAVRAKAVRTNAEPTKEEPATVVSVKVPRPKAKPVTSKVVPANIVPTKILPSKAFPRRTSHDRDTLVDTLKDKLADAMVTRSSASAADGPNYAPKRARTSAQLDRGAMDEYGGLDVAVVVLGQDSPPLPPPVELKPLETDPFPSAAEPPSEEDAGEEPAGASGNAHDDHNYLNKEQSKESFDEGKQSFDEGKPSFDETDPERTTSDLDDADLSDGSKVPIERKQDFIRSLVRLVRIRRELADEDVDVEQDDAPEDEAPQEGAQEVNAPQEDAQEVDAPWDDAPESETAAPPPPPPLVNGETPKPTKSVELADEPPKSVEPPKELNGEALKPTPPPPSTPMSDVGKSAKSTAPAPEASPAEHREHGARSPSPDVAAAFEEVQPSVAPVAPPGWRACPLCPAIVFGLAGYREHMLANHMHPQPYTCMLCWKAFLTARDLIRHTDSNCKEVFYKCQRCDRVWSSDRHHASCEFCDAGREDAHKDVDKDSPYECASCARTFPLLRHLTAHVKTHPNVDKPFKCHMCAKKRFSNSIHLMIHVRQHRLSPSKRSQLGTTPSAASLRAAPAAPSTPATPATPAGRVGRPPGRRNGNAVRAKVRAKVDESSDELTEDSEDDQDSEDDDPTFDSAAAEDSDGDENEDEDEDSDEDEDEDENVFKEQEQDLDPVDSKLPTVPEGCTRFGCRWCPKVFRLRHQARVHMRLHTNERPFCCRLCETAFSKADLLQDHLKATHSLSGALLGRAFKTMLKLQRKRQHRERFRALIAVFAKQGRLKGFGAASDMTASVLLDRGLGRDLSGAKSKVPKANKEQKRPRQEEYAGR